MTSPTSPEPSAPTSPEQSSGPSDAELLRRVVCGDQGCFDELVARHQMELEEATRSLTSSEAEARLLMKRTLEAAWHGARFARPGSNAGPWLVAVARHEASALRSPRSR